MMKLIAAAITAMAIFSTGVNAEATTDNIFCKKYAKLGEHVMVGRQMGKSKDFMLALADSNGYEPGKELFEDMVESAYRFPIKDTKAEKVELVKEFSKERYDICMEVFG